MKEKKRILSIKTHVGVHTLGSDLTISVEKHKVNFEFLPMGILVKSARGQTIVTYDNITHIEVEDESAK